MQTLLQGITVKDFRAFAEFEFRGFGRLNAIVGPNSTGKSALLDAIQLGLNTDKEKTLDEILLRRRHEPQWLGYKAQRWLSLNPSIQIWSKDYEFPYLEIDLREPIQVNLGGSARRPPEMSVPLIDPANPCSIPKLYTEIVRNQKGPDCLSILKSIAPTLESLTILSDSQEKAELNFVYPDRVVPVSVEGEGIKAVLNAYLQLSASGSLVALMEEPENFLHPAALKKMVQFILAAVDSGIQIFLTTHSLELLEALLQLSKLPAEDFAVIRMVRDQGRIVGVRRNSDEARELLHEIGVDLR